MTAVEIERTRLEVASLDLQADTILEARYVASAGIRSDNPLPCFSVFHELQASGVPQA